MNIKQFYAKIREEEARNERFLHLTPNEPCMSNTAREFMSSKLADRYYFGAGKDGIVDFGGFTALGFPAIEQLVGAAENAAKEMLSAAVVNLNCLSGVHAMMCALLSTTQPGDVVMTIHHDHGGHFATKGIIDRIGRKHVFAVYNSSAMTFDATETAKVYHASNAKAFYMDASYYIAPHNLRDLRRALGDEAIIIYDASHTMGLIMGQQFQSPLQEGANVICANTHKTLPGPQKGMIAFRDKEFGDKASTIINDCLYSSVHTASLIALATTILEMKEFGVRYAAQIVANSNALGLQLEKRGYQVRTVSTHRYSENHQVHMLTEQHGNYRELYDKLHANAVAVTFDEPTILNSGSFIRLGTQEITRRGMMESDMDIIASFIDRSVRGEIFPDVVEAFNRQFRKVHYSFDDAVSVKGIA